MPIFVEHMPVGLTAQAAGNVGANRNAAQSWQEQVQAQQLARQQQEMQLRLQQEQDRGAQQDFRNSLDLAQYNRQMGQGQALNDYRTNSLQERTQHGQDVVGQRRSAQSQRLAEINMRISAGTATAQDHYEKAVLLQQAKHDDAMALQQPRLDQRNDQFNSTLGFRRDVANQRNQRALSRAEWEQRKFSAASGQHISDQELSLRKFKAQQELNALKSQGASLSREALANKDNTDPIPGKEDTGMTVLDDIIGKLQDNRDAQSDLVDQIKEMQVYRPQQQPTSQPIQPTAPPSTQPSQDSTTGIGPNWEAGGSQPKYYIGQVIDTPKGKAIVTGLTNPSDPDVRLAQ